MDVVSRLQKRLAEWWAERRAKSRAATKTQAHNASATPDLLAHPPVVGAPHNLLNRKLGGYEIREQIGAGGMGTVYKAWQASMERFVAVKVLPAHLTHDAQFLERFRREAKAIAQLEHPHILPAYDFGTQDGVLYIAMRYVAGGTLRDLMRRGPLPSSELIRLGAQIGGALAHAHQNGVIHRDLKPGNILLSPEGEAFLGDFGLARLAALSPVSGSSVIGTPAYMSPEQGQGLPADARSDVYALGILLFELATGRLPFEADTALGLILKHIHEPLPRPRQLVPQLPETLEQVIVRATAKDPAARYQTAGELVAALTGKATQRIEPAAVVAKGETPPFATDDDLLKTPTDQLPAFIAGPPIVHPARFFGRERELRRLFNLLKRPPLQNAAIIGPRRSGKTSLLYYLKHLTRVAPEQLRPAQRTEAARLSSAYRWILVDFQDPRFGRQEELLRHILVALQLPIPNPCNLDHFLSTVAHQLTTPTVLLLDEMGVALQRYPELDNAFWEGLRSLATHQANGQLGFVLASHAPPEQLAQQSGMGSPFFNIFGYSTQLGPLTEAEAHALIASAPRPFAPEDVAWIMQTSGGWPMLLQILCRERLLALEEGESGEAWRAEAVRQMEPFKQLRVKS